MSEPSLHNPVVILVRPQMGENIGAAARAMLNFGLTDMRLVDPRDGWPNPRAVAMASGAGSAVQVRPRTGSRERECGAHQARRWSALHPDADADVT